MKLLSVVVPCYNSAEYMSHCIDTLLSGGEDVEILIVNDGSTKDNTAEIADAYAKKYPSIIKAIHQENKGHGGAVNTGIDNATGLYFKVVDSDDWVDTSAFARVLDALSSIVRGPKKLDVFLANYVYEKVDSRRKPVMRYRSCFPKEEIFGWDQVKRLTLTDYVLMHSMIVRTELLREVGLRLPEHTFYVDNIFAYIPFSKVNTMYYMDVNLYRYYIGRADQSVNEETMIKRIDQQLKVNNIMIDYLPETKNLPRRQRNFMYHSLGIIMNVSSILMIRSKNAELLARKKELWKHLKKTDARAYRYIRWSLSGNSMNLPGKSGRVISVAIYKVARLVYGFN